jgi:hypothetical protein
VRFFSVEEERRIRQLILERAKRFPSDWEQRLAQIDTAINTGTRKCEQFGLTWKDVHLDEESRALPLLSMASGGGGLTADCAIIEGLPAHRRSGRLHFEGFAAWSNAGSAWPVMLLLHPLRREMYED